VQANIGSWYLVPFPWDWYSVALILSGQSANRAFDLEDLIPFTVRPRHSPANTASIRLAGELPPIRMKLKLKCAREILELIDPAQV
jgi:hypothetical protein